MADDIATLGFAVETGGLGKGERALDSYARKGESTERRTDRSVKAMKKVYLGLAATIGTVIAAAKSMSKAVDVQREFDVLNGQLVTATGNAQNAAAAFQALSKFANETPYSLQQATNGFTQLVNLGLTPSEAALTSYGNTASAMGKDLSQMVEAVADATTGEFERLKEFGIKSKSEGDKVSFTFQGVTKEIGKNAAEIEDYLMNIGNVNFAGSMSNQMQSLNGKIAILENSWNTMFLAINENGLDSAMKSSVELAIGYVEDFTSSIKSGQLNGLMNTVAKSWQLAFGNIADNIKLLTDVISAEFNAMGVNGASTSNVISDAFFHFPSNIRAAIEIATTEVWGFVEKAKIAATQLSDVFSDKSFAEIDSDGAAKTAAIDAIISKSYAKISIARADAITQINLERDAANKLRIEYDALVVPDLDLGQFKIDKKKNEQEESTDTNSSIREARFKAEQEDYERRQAAYAEYLDSVKEATKTQAEIIKEKMAEIQSDMDTGFGGRTLDKDTGNKRLEQLRNQLDEINSVKLGNPFDDMTKGAGSALKSIQSMTGKGSKEYKQMGVAIAANNALQAIGAVLNQASGDPYSAFARMAAMAASVASLGQSVGSLNSSDGGNTAQDAQDAQGLNVWGEKSESISNSIDMTASATDKLVGINTNMLKALQTMQVGINKAAGIVARDVTTPVASAGRMIQGGFDMDALTDMTSGVSIGAGIGSVVGSFIPVIGTVIGGIIGGAIGGLMGGSSKVANEGIKILGGQLGNLMEDVTVKSFQEVSYKKWRWGKTKHKTVESDISGQVGSQIELVFKSLADSVFMGATALGISAEVAEKKINEYNIATTTISTKGLSASQQQKELEAVFSRIFDGLASSVITFLPDLQKVGEGLGETLSRVAIQVNIAEIAVDSFGFTFFNKMANPEMFAKAADNLTTLTGGVEQFAEKTSSFINDFAPESVKLNLYTKSLSESLEGVGLSLPATSEGMFKLMQSLDGTTAEGQEQIATLLNIQNRSKEYYNLLDKATKKQEQAMKSLSKTIQGTIDSIYSVNSKRASMSLDAALSSARSGNFDAAKKLDFNALKPKEKDFSTLADFNIAQAEVANKLRELQGLTGTGTVEDRTLEANNKQVELLTSINKNLGGEAASTEKAEADKTKEEKFDKMMAEMTDLQRQQMRHAAVASDLLDQIANGTITVRNEVTA